MSHLRVTLPGCSPETGCSCSKTQIFNVSDFLRTALRARGTVVFYCQWYRKISRERRDHVGHPRAWRCCWPQESRLFQWALRTEVLPEAICASQLWNLWEYETWVSFLKEARMSLVWAMCRKKKDRVNHSYKLIVSACALILYVYECVYKLSC